MPLKQVIISEALQRRDIMILFFYVQFRKINLSRLHK